MSLRQQHSNTPYIGRTCCLAHLCAITSTAFFHFDFFPASSIHPSLMYRRLGLSANQFLLLKRKFSFRSGRQKRAASLRSKEFSHRQFSFEDRHEILGRCQEKSTSQRL